jgi:hypothetical protein
MAIEREWLGNHYYKPLQKNSPLRQDSHRNHPQYHTILSSSEVKIVVILPGKEPLDPARLTTAKEGTTTLPSRR